jgi:hypothetical protein
VQLALVPLEDGLVIHLHFWEVQWTLVPLEYLCVPLEVGLVTHLTFWEVQQKIW